MLSGRVIQGTRKVRDAGRGIRGGVAGLLYLLRPNGTTVNPAMQSPLLRRMRRRMVRAEPPDSCLHHRGVDLFADVFFFVSCHEIVWRDRAYNSLTFSSIRLASPLKMY